ncbi:hypothetical protein [Mitsuaria sp. 7]|uniref:hypothetical protein n=1 Tax=Mitsuaria sp. 7 TaxID=1658665 RepID=UPI0012F74141|nr:hypothetical protein [Mitsuaria sp. 7]
MTKVARTGPFQSLDFAHRSSPRTVLILLPRWRHHLLADFFAFKYMQRPDAVWAPSPFSMRTCLNHLLALALCSSFGACWATSRIGNAEVLLQDGQPCFFLSSKDVKRDPIAKLQGISVSDLSTRPVATVSWVMFDASPAVPQSSAACYVYGQFPPASKSGPMSTLTNGKVYSAFLNVCPSDTSDPTRGYDVSFCLAGEGAERRLVPAEFWRNGSCH